MKRSSADNWSVFRSLAFLAAVFAMALAVMLPRAAAASAPAGDAVMLCSGEQMLVVYDENGSPRRQEPADPGGLRCPDCVVAAFASFPPPPCVEPAPPPALASFRRALVHEAPSPSVVRIDWGPPSTAPPAA